MKVPTLQPLRSFVLMSFQPTEGRVGARSFTHSRCKLKLVELALESLHKGLKSTLTCAASDKSKDSPIAFCLTAAGIMGCTGPPQKQGPPFRRGAVASL
jgi:hypothetical protein